MKKIILKDKPFIIDIIVWLLASISYLIYSQTKNKIAKPLTNYINNKKKILLYKTFGVPIKKNNTLKPTGIYDTVMVGEKQQFNDWNYSLYNRK